MSAENAQHQSTRNEEIHYSDGSLFAFANSQDTYCVICYMTFLSRCVLQVAVKCRPLRERERGRDIVRVIENKVSSADCGLKFLFCFGFCQPIYC